MKKKIVLILSLAMLLFVLSGCGANGDKPPVDTTPATTGEEVLKTGMAIISTFEKSADAGEADGLAQVDSTVVAVTVDKDSKITNCKIDAAQTKINFSKAGALTTHLDTVFKSKQELGTEYGMAKASSIKKEWFEQANALAEYVVGKTAAEVKGIAVNEEGVPTAAELTSSVTIKIGGYIAAIETAVNNANDIGAGSGNKLGLGVYTTIEKSKDASENDGVAQAYSNYAAVTFGADDKITSCIIDASQSNVNFSKEGKITSDKSSALKTKRELGADYGMAKVSTIKKEWFEQADALAKYVVGKTVAEVKGITLDEKGAPSNAELSSSVTVSIADYITVIEKAAANAK